MQYSQMQEVYLEVVSVSMKSQYFETPTQASVLVSASVPGYNYAKQSKSIEHLEATTSRQWWMFKDIHTFPVIMKEQKIQVKLYGSGSAVSKQRFSDESIVSSSLTENTVSPGMFPIPRGNNSRLEVCIGKLDLSLTQLSSEGPAITFEMNPVSITSFDDRDKSIPPTGKLIASTITLRLMSDLPPIPLSIEDKVACKEDVSVYNKNDSILGTIRLVVWQGKNLNTDYPVFLDTRTNQRSVRRFKSLSIANPHNPIFDTIQEFDILSLQGDLFITLVTDHSLRSNKPLGQVVIPFSWLTKRMIEYESKVSISGWFELFPYNKITKYNGGGKYIPYMKDIPLGLGIENCIGLAIPDKPIGFIKLDVSLNLHRTLLYTLIRNPFCVEEKPCTALVDDGDAVDLLDIYVTKHNFYRIMDTLTNPLWLSTFKDIIRWKHHPGVTFFAIFLYGYTCLLAEVWMFPFLFVVFVIFVGFVASYDRHFHVDKLFVDEKEEMGKLQKEEEGSSKSLAEKYKAMKQSVHKMEQRVRLLASQVEKLNNLFLWSDPTLSITALFYVALVTLLASIMLSLVPPHICCFLGGLVVFVPQEGMGRIKKIKRTCYLLFQRLYASYAVRYDTTLPEGQYLKPLNLSHMSRSLTGHILSGDLYSQTWTGTAPEGQKSSSNWTRKWCELWALPGVLKVADEMSYDVTSKAPTLYDVTYVKARYIGKSAMNINQAGKGDNSSDDLYIFEVQYLMGAKAEKLKQVVWPNYEASGWVFGCTSFGDAQTWVKAINKVTFRVPFRTILDGEDFRKSYSSTRNIGMVSLTLKTLWRWVMLVPDNLELQHRHFCEQSYVRSKFTANKSTRNMGFQSESMSNNDLDVVHVGGKSKGEVSDAYRYLTVGHDMRSIGCDEALRYGGENEDIVGSASGIHVSLYRARGLKVKNTDSKAKGWLLAASIPKIYVNLSLSSKAICGLNLRTGGQPRSSEPVFREDFVFPDVDYDLMLKNDVSLQLEVSVRTPMAFGLSSDSVQILGRIQIPLKPWLEQKIDERADRPDEVKSLEEERWYTLISHTVPVGELKLQITCL